MKRRATDCAASAHPTESDDLTLETPVWMVDMSSLRFTRSPGGGRISARLPDGEVLADVTVRDGATDRSTVADLLDAVATHATTARTGVQRRIALYNPYTFQLSVRNGSKVAVLAAASPIPLPENGAPAELVVTDGLVDLFDASGVTLLASEVGDPDPAELIRTLTAHTADH